MFYFDPNIASEEEFAKLGFSQKAIKSIINFRNKKGKFYKKEDLKKIYNVSEEEYDAVKDYIVIQESGHKKNYREKEKKKISYFNFDPNTAGLEDFEALGLKKWQALNILNYREKGGYFTNKEDFSKIYGLSESDFEKLKPYIEIKIDSSKIRTKTQTTNNRIKKDKTIIIELNSTNIEELQKLEGVGKFYAGKIIEYREKLGGYYQKQQLLEVYGINEELYYLIQGQIIVDTNKIKKININTADFTRLIKHPYFEKEEVKTILNYRKFAKEINSYEELLKQKAVSKELYIKTKPYITTKKDADK